MTLVTADFYKGREAYLLGDDDKIIGANGEFTEGFKDAWIATEGRKYDRYGDNAVDQAFENFVAQIESEFKRRTTPPSNLNHLKGTVHEFIINTLSDTPRKIALLFLAAIIPALVLGSLLFTESEVAAYTPSVLGGK